MRGGALEEEVEKGTGGKPNGTLYLMLILQRTGKKLGGGGVWEGGQREI